MLCRGGNMNPKPSLAASVAGPAILVLLLMLVIFISEGPVGLRPFLNLEALAIVALGTAAMMGSAYPLRELFAPRSAAAASYAAHCAMTMGLLGTLLGIILMMSSIEEVSMIPRRTALALTSLLFGLFLSEAVFSPMAARRRRLEGGREGSSGDDPGAGRLSAGIIGLFSGLMGLFMTLAVLYMAASH